MPTGAFASEVDAGGQVSGSLDLPLRGGPASVRIELSYIRFGSPVPGQNPRMVPLLLGLSFAIPGRGMQTYVVAGTGAYYFKSDNPTFDDNKLGLNGGAGVVWRRVSFEGRYHSVFDRGDSYFAVTAGVRL